jgi:hypothetical protein
MLQRLWEAKRWEALIRVDCVRHEIAFPQDETTLSLI